MELELEQKDSFIEVILCIYQVQGLNASIDVRERTFISMLKVETAGIIVIGVDRDD